MSAMSSSTDLATVVEKLQANTVIVQVVYVSLLYCAMSQRGRYLSSALISPQPSLTIAFTLVLLPPQARPRQVDHVHLHYSYALVKVHMRQIQVLQA